MYLVTGYSEPIIRQWIHTKNKEKSEKNVNSINVLPPSGVVDGVKTNSSLLCKPVQHVAGLDCGHLAIYNNKDVTCLHVYNIIEINKHYK